MHITLSLHHFAVATFKFLTVKGFYGEHHTYANQRYEQLVGVQSPVEARVSHGKAHITHIASHLFISRESALALDVEAKMTVSHELGHS